MNGRFEQQPVEYKEGEELSFAQYVGLRIRQKRTEKAMFIKELSEETGICRPFISEVEHGYKSLGFERMFLIAQALDTPIDWFVEGVGK